MNEEAEDKKRERLKEDDQGRWGIFKGSRRQKERRMRGRGTYRKRKAARGRPDRSMGMRVPRVSGGA